MHKQHLHFLPNAVGSKVGIRQNLKISIIEKLSHTSLKVTTFNVISQTKKKNHSTVHSLSCSHISYSYFNKFCWLYVQNIPQIWWFPSPVSFLAYFNGLLPSLSSFILPSNNALSWSILNDSLWIFFNFLSLNCYKLLQWIPIKHSQFIVSHLTFTLIRIAMTIL